MRTKKISKIKSHKDVRVGFAGIATMALGVTALSLFGKALASIRDKLKDRKIIKKIQSGELKEYEDFVKPIMSIYLNEIKGNISEQKYILSKWKHVPKEEYEKYGKERLEKEKQEEQNIMSKLKKEYERAKQVRTFDDLLEVFPDHPYLRKEIERSKYLLQKAKSQSTKDSFKRSGEMRISKRKIDKMISRSVSKRLNRIKRHRDDFDPTIVGALLGGGLIALYVAVSKTASFIGKKLEDRRIIKKIQSGELKEYDLVKPFVKDLLHTEEMALKEYLHVLADYNNGLSDENEFYGDWTIENIKKWLPETKQSIAKLKQIRTFDELLNYVKNSSRMLAEIKKVKKLYDKAKSQPIKDSSIKTKRSSIQLHKKATSRDRKTLPFSRKRLKLNDNTKKLSTKQQEVDMNIKRYIDTAVKKELRRLHQRSRVTPQKKVYKARRHNDYLELLDGKKIWLQVKKMIKTLLQALKQTIKDQPVYSKLFADFLKLYAFWDGLMAVRDIGRAEYQMFKQLIAKIKQEETEIDTKQVIRDLVSGIERLGLAFFKLFLSKKVQRVVSSGETANKKSGSK